MHCIASPVFINTGDEMFLKMLNRHTNRQDVGLGVGLEKNSYSEFLCKAKRDLLDTNYFYANSLYTKNL